MTSPGRAFRPGAFQLPNDARMARYSGAGPPEDHGKHRYIFAVLALAAEKVEIDREATPAWLMFSLFNGTLDMRSSRAGTRGRPSASTPSYRKPDLS